MMNELQIFNFHEQELRTIERDGNLWWVLKDVCEAVELGSPHKVAERLDEDEKGRNLIPTPGGPQEMTIINESGLYNVILRSDKPEAKEFKRWVTHDVLPTLRQTGSYVINTCASKPEKTGELASYIKVVGHYMEKQGSPANEIMQMIQAVSIQHGINLPMGIVKPPNPYQMALYNQ